MKLYALTCSGTVQDRKSLPLRPCRLPASRGFRTCNHHRYLERVLMENALAEERTSAQNLLGTSTMLIPPAEESVAMEDPRGSPVMTVVESEDEMGAVDEPLPSGYTPRSPCRPDLKILLDHDLEIMENTTGELHNGHEAIAVQNNPYGSPTPAIESVVENHINKLGGEHANLLKMLLLTPAPSPLSSATEDDGDEVMGYFNW